MWKTGRGCKSEREIDRLAETNKSNRLELDQHYHAGQIQLVICVCVSVCAVNLFIYLSLAAIVFFIPSLSVSVYLVMGDWVSCVA